MPYRRSRKLCIAMPEVLTSQFVTDIYQWPLGNVMTAKAAGENWTDCLVMIRDDVRLGGRYNCRRVRYDGVFYVMHNGRRVPLSVELSGRVHSVACHVYGTDSDADKAHNRTLKGY